MSFGGNDAQPTQTTTVTMSPEQRMLYKLALPGVKSFAASVPERYAGSTIAPFDPLQTQGQNMALSAAQGQQAPLVGNAANANNFLLSDIWNPSSNPNLQGAIDAAVRPVTQQYQETVLPRIRDEFQAAGQQFGGSRRGVAEGVAARGYMDTVADTASKITQEQYANNLNAQLKALGLAPQTTQNLLAPGMTTSGVGDVRQSMAQALLGEDVSNFNYDQLAPFLQSKEILSLISGLPGGTTTATANNPPQAPWWQQALGGGLAAIGSGGGGGLPIGSLLAFL